jgi:ATP-dependent Clp protease ATP-binding subunit ClpA
VEVTFSDELRKHLAKKGFDPLMGARPMQRLIQDTIRRRWPTSCCSAAWSNGGRLEVDWDEAGNEGKGDVKLTITELPKDASKPSPSRQWPIEASHEGFCRRP